MQFAGQINGKFQTVLLNAFGEKAEYLANKTGKLRTLVSWFITMTAPTVRLSFQTSVLYFENLGWLRINSVYGNRASVHW